MCTTDCLTDLKREGIPFLCLCPSLLPSPSPDFHSWGRDALRQLQALSQLVGLVWLFLLQAVLRGTPTSWAHHRIPALLPESFFLSLTVSAAKANYWTPLLFLICALWNSLDGILIPSFFILRIVLVLTRGCLHLHFRIWDHFFLPCMFSVSPSWSKWTSTLPVFQSPVLVIYAVPLQAWGSYSPCPLSYFRTKAQPLQAAPQLGSCLLTVLRDVSGVQKYLKSGLQLSSSLYACVLPNCWIDPLILCCPLVPARTWDFCSLELLVRGHPGLLHTPC